MNPSRHERSGCRRRRRGASMVEIAIILPMLLAMTIAAVDFSRFAITYITVTNAARAGAGRGSMRPYTPDTFPDWQQQVREAVVAEMEGLGSFDENALQFATPVITVEAGQPRRMRIVVGYPFATIAAWPLVPDSVVIHQAVEMPFIR